MNDEFSHVCQVLIIIQADIQPFLHVWECFEDCTGAIIGPDVASWLPAPYGTWPSLFCRWNLPEVLQTTCKSGREPWLSLTIQLQCLEVCKKASEISTNKIFRVGEVVAKDESDQMVVSTLADLFDLRKALSQDNAKQLVASLAPEDLRHLAELRYGNHLRTSSYGSHTGETTISGMSFVPEAQKETNTSAPWNDEKPSIKAKAKPDRPSSNETKKRATSDVME